MKRVSEFIKKSVMAVIMVGVMAGILSGCNDSPAQKPIPQHAVIIVGNTKYEPVFETTSLKKEISQLTLVEGSTVTVINSDGDPKLIDNLTIPAYKKGISDDKKRQLSEGYTDQILAILAAVRPDNEEMDLFRAISMGARQLQQYDSGNKIMYIASSGLSTTNLVDFTKLYLEQDHSEELVGALKAELPDLTDLKVVWQGLGEVSGMQTNLYESNRTILKNTWESILKNSGAADVEFPSGLAVNTEEKKENIPDVSLVPISQPIDLVVSGDLEPASEGESEKTTVLDLSKKVSFKPDTAELLTSKNVVRSSLSKIISYLKGKDTSILLVGTTASCGEEKSLQRLSLKRCQTIKDILVSTGVKETQIQCVGAGYHNNLTSKDTDAKGNLIEERAAGNRKVYLFTDANSPAAQKILKQFGQ